MPYQIYKAKTAKTAKEGGFEVKKNELDWTSMSAKVKEEFEQLFANGDSIKVDPNEIEIQKDNLLDQMEARLGQQVIEEELFTVSFRII